MKIVKIALGILLTVCLLTCVCIFIPAFKEVFLFLAASTWTVVKNFLLMDSIKKVVLYVAALLVIAGLGFTITKKTDNRIWAAAGGIVDALGVVLCLVANK